MICFKDAPSGILSLQDEVHVPESKGVSEWNVSTLNDATAKWKLESIKSL